MWIGGIDWKKLLKIVSSIFVIVTIILSIAWFIPEDVYRRSDSAFLNVFERAYTWVARIENFVGGEDDNVDKYKITNENYQENHAQMAVARGGFIPKGPGTSVERNYLPEAFSDFIFAIIVEELGFFMGVVEELSVWAGFFVMILYLCLLFRAGRVVRQTDSLFCAILVIGVTMMIVLQAFIHIGVSVHLGPVTGQPLPLISRGGTSILVNCVYFGLIISVTRYIQQQKMKKEMVEDAVIAEPSEPKIEQNDSLETEIVEEVNIDTRQ